MLIVMIYLILFISKKKNDLKVNESIKYSRVKK